MIFRSGGDLALWLAVHSWLGFFSGGRVEELCALRVNQLSRIRVVCDFDSVEGWNGGMFP